MGWQPIETAPKDGSYFLAVCEADCGTRNHWIVRWDADHDGFECGYDAEGLFTAQIGMVPCLAHWMPLPEPPNP